MAEGRIEKKSISVKDPFGDITDSARKARDEVKAGVSELEAYELILKSIVQTAKLLKAGSSGADPSDNKSIKERNELLERANKLLEAKLKNEVLLKKAREDLTKSTKKSITADSIEAEQLVSLELKTNKLAASKNELIKKQKQADAQRRLGNAEKAKELDLTEKEKTQLVEITNQLTLTNLQKAKSRKLNKEQIEELSGLTDEYEKQSKRLNKLRKELKSLLLVEGKTTKETKRLEKEVGRLDRSLKDVDEAAGQFQRNVGNYPDTLGKAAKAMAVVAAGALSIDAAFGGISTSLNDTAEGSENVREISSKLGGVFDQVKNVVSATALDLFDYGAAVVESVQGGKGLIDSLTEQEDQFERTSESTTDFTDKVKESALAQEALTKKVIEFEKASRPLEVRISNLNGLIEQQQIIAGDSTRSFNEINAAILKGQDLQVKRSNISVSLAKQELQITQERIRIANLAGGAGVDILDQETEAITKLIDAENALKNEILENEKEIRQVKQDRLEIDLDILIDGFDNQKTINERIIANEKETLQVRGALLKETAQLAEDSFRGQKEVLEELSSAGINVDDLLLLDATELAKQIQLLGQSEIINTRTLEVIRERKIVLQDLKDAQDDLNESEQDSIDIRKDIIAQEDALFAIITGNAEEAKEAIEKLEEQREQDNINNLIRRLDLEEEGSSAKLEIEQELNDALLDQQESRIEKEEENEKKAKKAEEKATKERIENAKKAIQLVEDVHIRSIDARIDKLSEEEQKHKDQVNTLEQAARDGNIIASESLAQEKILADEAVQRQKELEQEKQNFLLVTAVLKAFTLELENPENAGNSLKAFGKAVISVGSVEAFASALPTFIEGTANVGESLGAPQLSGQDGYVIRVDGAERIIDPANNAKIGNFTNDEVARTMEQKRLGNLMGDSQIMAIGSGIDFAKMEAGLNRIEQAIIDKPESNLGLGAVLQTGFELKHSVKRGNETTTSIYKIRK